MLPKFIKVWSSISAIDMALLSFADHSIRSYGTFGMWGAFLAGKGETLLPSDLRKIGAGRQFATETAEIPCSNSY